MQNVASLASNAQNPEVCFKSQDHNRSRKEKSVKQLDS